MIRSHGSCSAQVTHAASYTLHHRMRAVALIALVALGSMSAARAGNRVAASPTAPPFTGPLAILQTASAMTPMPRTGPLPMQFYQRYSVSLVNVAGHVVASVSGRALRGLLLLDAATPLLSIVSASSHYLYYLDGNRVRVLDASGTTHVAVGLPATNHTLFGFAVSPDDRTIAVTALDYTIKVRPAMGGATALAAGRPEHERLYTQDLRTGRVHDLFTAAVTTATSSFAPVWPLGWRGSALILAVGADGQQQMPPNPADAWQGYHVVSSVDATRYTTVCGGNLERAEGPIVPAGTACAIPNTTGVIVEGWDGTCSRFPVPDFLLQGVNQGSLLPSPDGAYLAFYAPTRQSAAIFRQGQDSYIDVHALQPLGWLDRRHLLAQNLAGTSTRALATYDLASGKTTPVQLPVATASAAFLGTLPGSLGAVAPTHSGVIVHCG